MDIKLIDESNVIIVTPEKAKALIRGNKNLLESIKLIIIDEGHLIGKETRNLKNEIFYDELKYYMNKCHGALILLSAVLPNPQIISEWLYNKPNEYYSTSWRPATERLGKIIWDGQFVNITWEGTEEERSFYNVKFIKQEERLFKKKRILYPNSFQSAIALTAIKLANNGSVLIYVGRKASVFTYSEAILNELERQGVKFKWKNMQDWLSFQQACNDAFGFNSKWVRYAEYGIICHNSSLPEEARIYAEKLIRGCKPPFIVATSTLGQGVNIGVSTVIFTSYFNGQEQLSYRDFWNICGRAGRAFVDSEGKILLSINKSIEDNNKFKPQIKARDINKWRVEYREYTNKRAWEIKKTENNIKKFFDKSKMENAESGLLSSISKIKNVISEYDIDFNYLLQLIVENKLDYFGEWQEKIDSIFDHIDDTLLALIIDTNGLSDINSSNDIDVDLSQLEIQIRGMLAFIQAKYSSEITDNEFQEILLARAKSIIKSLDRDKSYWLSLVSTGLPLAASKSLSYQLYVIIPCVDNYIRSERSPQDLFDLLEVIENLIYEIYIIKNCCTEISNKRNNLDEIRNLWINGDSYKLVTDFKDGNNIVNKYFKFALPWVLNALSKIMKSKNYIEQSFVVDILSLMAELGLPNILTIRLFMLGIRSRRACVETARSLRININEEIDLLTLKYHILANYSRIISSVSTDTQFWLELIFNPSVIDRQAIKKVKSFMCDDAIRFTDVLNPISFNKEMFLCSPDFEFKVNSKDVGVDIKQLENIIGIEFIYNENTKLWDLNINNPNIDLD